MKKDKAILYCVIVFLLAGLLAVLFIKKIQVHDFLSRSEVTMEKAQKIHKGMDRLEVRSVLGAPHDTGTATMIDYEGIVETYQNSQKNLNVNVIFKDEKVEMMTINQDVILLQP
ncbi:MAG: hypothetical protein ACOY3I_01565 [Verrucomicrobiota bacterium]